jgi:hypothetical protein
LRDLVELNDLVRLNERYINHRLKEAQMKAKQVGVNLFVIRPDEIPPGLGLLEIDSKVIEFVKAQERKRMKEYLDDLQAHNLRFAPPLS